MTVQPTFSTLLERYFTQRLVQQRQASAHTIASYRDTFRLLLQFARRQLHRAPSALAIDDINAPFVVEFLDELEKTRNVTARTRSLRLTAIRSFFRFVAFEAPAHAAQIQRVLAIPQNSGQKHPFSVHGASPMDGVTDTTDCECDMICFSPDRWFADHLQSYLRFPFLPSFA